MADSKLTPQRDEGPTNDKQASVVCNPCQNDNTLIPAKTWCGDCNEFLCIACSRYHRKLTALRHHRLVSVNDMKSLRKVEPFVDKCDAHNGMRLKYFCEDHEKLFCCDCFVSIHRTCNKVVCLADVASQETERFKELENNLCKLEEDLNIQQRMVKENKKLLVQENRKADEQIDDVGVGVISVIERLMKDAKMKINQIKCEDMEKIQSVEKSLSDASFSLKGCKEVIESGLGNEVQLFIAMEQVQKVIKTLTLKLEETAKLNSFREFDFVGSGTLSTCLDSVRVLGCIVDEDLHNIEPNENNNLMLYEVRRFKTSGGAIWVSNNVLRSATALSVSTNGNAKLVYILLYSFGNVRLHVTLDIKEGENSLVHTTIPYASTKAEVFRVTVVRKDGRHGIVMKSGQQYYISIRLSYSGQMPLGFTQRCGQNILKTVTTKGVGFSFSDDKPIGNELIAGLLFTN